MQVAVNWALFILFLAASGTFLWAIKPGIKRAREAGYRHGVFDLRTAGDFMRPELPIIAAAFCALILVAILSAAFSK